jgi:hypothetical protein
MEANPAAVNRHSNDEIIYTPPDGMTSSNSATMLTATLGSVPAPDASSANISIREYIYYLPYPLPPHSEIPYSIHLPVRNPLGLADAPFEVRYVMLSSEAIYLE